jgi:hypothetical protein
LDEVFVIAGKSVICQQITEFPVGCQSNCVYQLQCIIIAIIVEIISERIVKIQKNNKE